MPNYIVLEDFLAPKKEKESDGNRLQRQFNKGEFIGGKADGYAMMKGERVHVILESEGFMIPAKNLKQVNKENGNNVSIEAEKMNLEVQKIVNKNIAKDLIEKSKASAKGGVIGLFGGLAYALYSHRSLIWFGFIGSVVGGLMGYQINKVITKKNINNN